MFQELKTTEIKYIFKSANIIWINVFMVLVNYIGLTLQKKSLLLCSYRFDNTCVNKWQESIFFNP